MSNNFPQAPEFPEETPVAENLLDRNSHDLLSAKHAQPLSVVLAIYRDGRIVPFSPIDANGRATANDYSTTPLDIGRIGYANALTVVQSVLPEGVVRTGTWYWQNNRWRCVG